MILLAHGRFGNGVDERVEGGPVYLSALVEIVASRLTAVVLHRLN